MPFEDATQLAALVASKARSPVEIVRAHLDQIEAVNPRLNAIVTLTAERALEEAERAEQAVMHGDDLGRLHGVPFTVKDSLDTARHADAVRVSNFRGAHSCSGREMRSPAEESRGNPARIWRLRLNR